MHAPVRLCIYPAPGGDDETRPLIGLRAAAELAAAVLAALERSCNRAPLQLQARRGQAPRSAVVLLMRAHVILGGKRMCWCNPKVAGACAAARLAKACARVPPVWLAMWLLHVPCTAR